MDPTPWADDADLLALLAAWDDSAAPALSLPLSLSSAGDSGSDGSSTTPRHHQATDKRRGVNTSRERRRGELAFLRDTVDGLQRQLHELQTRREEMLRAHYADESLGQLATAAPVWEGMAIRQFQARKKAEVANAKLRTMLAAQVRVAEDLIRVIQHAEQGLAAAQPPARLPIDASQRMTEEAQLARLETLCVDWADALAWCPKFADGPMQFLDMKVVEDAEDEVVFDLYSSAVRPFSVDRIEAALWALFLDEGGEVEGGELFTQDATATDDSIVAVFSATATLGEALRGRMSGKFVSKRFRHAATQLLIATHTYSEPEGFNRELDGVSLSEDAWIRLVDVHELGHAQLSRPLTAIQHVRRVRIRSAGGGGGAGPERSRVETLTRLIMNQVQEELLWAQQMVENLLLGDGRGSRIQSETSSQGVQ